jgi:uncharacterized protein YggT (Ycf19 family)
MEKENINGPLKAALDEAKVYIDLQIKLNKAVIAKKAEEFSSNFFLGLIFLFIAAFLMLFITLGFVSWYAENYGDQYVGYLIAAGFYLLVALIVYLFRGALVESPLRKLINKSVLDDAAEFVENPDISDKTFTDKYMLAVKERVIKQEAIVKQSYENIGKVYNFENISKQLLSNIYHSVVTTANIAKVFYTLTTKLKGRKQKKEHKKLKK